MADRQPPTARFPFSAVVALDDLKLALVLNAVSPGVGGVLIRGEKGTAKSTIVRTLATLLPDVAVVEGCRFACDPASPDPGCPDGPHEVGTGATVRPSSLVELPVGTSEDRLLGSLDLERALVDGVKAFEPGLLAAAHRGVLYVDEVNLLHDHLVDLLLDAAASGVSCVEREGVSVRHPARFLLVGTMNPEEGELRPQLLDRFGLTVEVRAPRDPAQRAEVVRRRLAFDADPAAFAARWEESEADLARRIADARALLPSVVLPDEALRQVSAVCAEFDVDGLRADLVTARAAIALAAWSGRDVVRGEDVRQAARLALPHRRRRDPFDAPGIDEEQLDEALRRAAGDGSAGPGGESGDPGPDGRALAGDEAGGHGRRADDFDGPEGPGGGAAVPPEPGPQGSVAGSAPASGDTPRGGSSQGRGSTESTSAPGATFRPRLLSRGDIGKGVPGRRSRAETPDGRATGARVPRGRLAGLHLAATLRAAAPHQARRGRTGSGLVLRAGDLREPVREGREGNLVLFVVDASGSMAARQRMRAVKGAVLSLLLDAYQRRDRVGLVTFRGRDATVVLPPTPSVEAGARRLADLASGGRTPLAAGLLRATEILRVERLRDPRRRPLLVVVTDGRATHGPGRGTDAVADARRAAAMLARDRVASIVVDCETGPVRLGLAARLAADLGGHAVRLEELAADALAGVVREARRAA